MQDLTEAPIIRWTSAWGRLLAAIVAGGVAWLATHSLGTELQLLTVFDVAAATFLASLAARMSYSDSATTARLAEKKETSDRLMLTLAVVLSGCSLAGVAVMLHRSADDTPFRANLHLGLSLLAVFLSWTILHALFGIHYARLYYDRDANGAIPPWGQGLEFPENAQPDFWDFMYFSFTLAVCYQVSDVTIRSRHVRRVTLAHVLLSFLNVTMIIGIVVEIVSTLVSAPGK